MNLTVVTSNRHKAAEVAAFFSGILNVDHVALDCPEHRDDDVSRIAEGKARFAYQQLGVPLIVDDTALSLPSLAGFPGPYAAYVQNTIGNAGILRLIDGVADRSALFTTAIAFADSEGIRVFTGVLSGTIAPAPRGCNGFGYDPIFCLPDGKTLAELTLNEKSAISHRSRALAAFRDWFVVRCKGSAGNTNG